VSSPTTTRAAARTVEAVWRIESARLIAALARTVRDIGLAEDLAQDALVAALEQWPESGVPDNPGAWLMAVAKRRAVDRVRRQITLDRKLEQIGRDLDETEDPVDETEFDRHVDDDVLRLMFTACHPVLAPPSRVALALKVLTGLSTDEIARAFLVPSATMAQRIVRAKRALADADVPLEVPVGDELAARLESVLEVVYLVFNEGYSATSGNQLTRPALCEEAMRLGRILAALEPDEPETHALVALMELQASRLPARTDAAGNAIMLLEQNRGRWDRLLITHGLDALARAERIGRPPGSYFLQASIAACHARANTPEQTDWSRIAALYTLLAATTGSPVVELNRAVAVGMSDGPTAGLSIVEQLVEHGALDKYHLLYAVRADLLAKLGRTDAARADFERAAAMTANERERALLLARATEC